MGFFGELLPLDYNTFRALAKQSFSFALAGGGPVMQNFVTAVFTRPIEFNRNVPNYVNSYYRLYLNEILSVLNIRLILKRTPYQDIFNDA